jgi:hypothetical protein
MKYRIAVLAAILTASVAVAAASVRPFGISSQNRGASSVCGNVVSARHAADLRGEPVFLTLGATDGEAELTVVMLEENRAGFGPPEAMVGRHICVSGRIQSFFGKPRMLLDSLAD